MGSERVYAVAASVAEPAEQVTLAEAGLKERADLQEWVIHHPEMLGPDILTVTTEFDRWHAASRARALDRLDVLGLDKDGRLVVAELKRDQAPDTVEMQALKYAAFASRFTEDTLVDQHLRHLRRTNPEQEVDAEAARGLLVTHAGGELDPAILARPRIVLVAGSFPPAVTAAVVWLTEMGLDISLQQAQAYRLTGGQLVVTVTQLYPLPEIEDFTVRPIPAGTDTIVRRRRERSAVARLVQSKIIPEGTVFSLRPTDLGPQERVTLEVWLAADENRGRATWRNDRGAPIVWAVDGNAYRPSPLVRHLLNEAGVSDRSVRGPAWWVDAEGDSLVDLAGLAAGGFDWTALHTILSEIGPGRWTTYGDLAAAVGTGAMALGQHIAGCDSCPNAWRVLGAEGTPRGGFRWSSPERTQTQQEALEVEDLIFERGRAIAARKVPLADLKALAAEARAAAPRAS